MVGAASSVGCAISAVGGHSIQEHNPEVIARNIADRLLENFLAIGASSRNSNASGRAAIDAVAVDLLASSYGRDTVRPVGLTRGELLA